ncbi:MAG: radical SAM protein [Prevotella sp.]
MKTGTIFSIEEFAIHDGPGIRTTVFLKGCPLRCSWCHNPEGISSYPQPMVKKGVSSVCGTVVAAGSLAAQLLKNVDIYKLNHGGVTFTGGEPLRQADFLEEVVSLLKPQVHVAVETSGYVAQETFRRVVSLMDYVLMDVKHTDPAIHKAFTGVDNGLILDNLNWLCQSNIPFVIRVPLIPGVNDTRENMLATMRLIEHAPSLQRVELLPYHKTAGAKYGMIGREYTPGFDVEAVPQVHNVFEEHGIRCLVQ